MEKRDRPYMQFNFVVTLDGINEAEAGFQECSNIGTELAVAEYRNGNDRENNVRKITGLNKATDVTLKRGIIGSKALYDWLDAIRNGEGPGTKNVEIALQDEAHKTVQTWTLRGARIIKYVSGPLNAKGTDVAMEELTLAYERLEMK